MAQAGVQIQLSIPEIYKQLCPKCQQKLKRLLAEKAVDKLVEPMLQPPK